MEELMKELNSIKKYIPYNTYHTIKGQMSPAMWMLRERESTE